VRDYAKKSMSAKRKTPYVGWLMFLLLFCAAGFFFFSLYQTVHRHGNASPLKPIQSPSSSTKQTALQNPPNKNTVRFDFYKLLPAMTVDVRDNKNS